MYQRLRCSVCASCWGNCSWEPLSGSLVTFITRRRPTTAKNRTRKISSFQNWEAGLRLIVILSRSGRRSRHFIYLTRSIANFRKGTSTWRGVAKNKRVHSTPYHSSVLDFLQFLPFKKQNIFHRRNSKYITVTMKTYGGQWRNYGLARLVPRLVQRLTTMILFVRLCSPCLVGRKLLYCLSPLVSSSLECDQIVPRLFPLYQRRKRVES